MKEFHTRERANEGLRLPLYRPDGTKSRHWLQVRGTDSDAFRLAETRAKRRVPDIAANPETRDEAMRELELGCIAALIADWSFDEKLTDDAAIKFLREAPQIADQVNEVAAQRARFFAKK